MQCVKGWFFTSFNINCIAFIHNRLNFYVTLAVLRVVELTSKTQGSLVSNRIETKFRTNVLPVNAHQLTESHFLI